MNQFKAAPTAAHCSGPPQLRAQSGTEIRGDVFDISNQRLNGGVRRAVRIAASLARRTGVGPVNARTAGQLRAPRIGGMFIDTIQPQPLQWDRGAGGSARSKRPYEKAPGAPGVPRDRP